MAASAPGFVVPKAGSAPYPGIRPFEAAESDRFFGRDRDADLLCEKILSGRLTVLYAQSGLGKSSLLRAKVIPLIEAVHSRVVYFDAWAQEDPLGALKDTLVRAAGELGIRDAGRGSPTLTELARILCSSDDRGLVLVLDQFEEFLVHHGETLDPVRSELAALLRAAKLDAAVVLSLREEFLAALEPLRQQILNLFQSTYRLENLDENGVRQAISRPAELFGKTCETELTERLIGDLRGRSAAGAAPGLSQLIELPMLQLVCRQLWEHAEGDRLTLALYEQMGGAQRILDEYVRGLMPKRWRDQSFTGRLLLHLAPASGLKMSFAAGDLVAITGLELAPVRRELDRLAAARILRTRVYRTAERYELQHDAFIPVLQAWRNHVIERERRMQWIGRLLVSAACVGLLTAALSWFFHYQHEEANRFVEMEQRRQAAEIGRRAAEQKSADDQTKYQLEKKLRDVQLEGKERELRQQELARQKAEALLRENTELKDKLEHWQSGGMVTDLRELPAADRAKFAPSRFDLVTYYVLHRVQGPGRMQQLRDLLEKYADLLPGDYGVLSTTAPTLAPDWPLRLEYPATRTLDANGFDAFWGEFRKEIVSSWAIPLPAHVRLVADRNLQGDQVRLVGGVGDANRLELTIPARARYLIRATPASLQPGPEREFIDQFDKDWQHFSPRPGIDYRLVPSWSLPVWKLAGQTAVTPGGVAAYTAILELLDKPEPLFSREGVETLLEHAAINFPQTVAEARAAVSVDLTKELAARVRFLAANGSGRTPRDALMALPQILDNLAQHVRANPKIEEKTGSDIGPDAKSNGLRPSDSVEPGSRSGTRLRGPWPRQQAGEGVQNAVGSSTERRYSAYVDLGSMFPPFYAIHVRVSNNLIPVWFPGNALSKPLSAGIEELRQQTYVEHGVSPPGFRFRSPEGEVMAPNTIRVEVRNDGPPHSVNGMRRLNGPDTLQGLFQNLRNTLNGTLDMWITAETANAVLTHLPPNTREWMEKKYSVTDMKELMRITMKSANDGSVRYPVWLMSSLPFWALLDDPLDGVAMGAHLAETQRARGKSRNEPDSALRRHLEQGTDALVRDDPSSAEAEFRAAIQLNAEGARDGFPTVWARRVPDVWVSEFRRQHRRLDGISLNPTEQLDLDDLSRSATAQGNRRAVWQLDICRLAGGQAPGLERTTALLGLIRQAPNPDEIPAADAGWLALQFFKQYDPLSVRKGDEQFLAEAKALMKSAVQRLEPAAALKAFDDLGTIAITSSTPNWGWPLLEELATLKPDRPTESLNLDLAWKLCAQERPEQLLRALKLVDGHEKVLFAGKLPEAELAIQIENINYVRASASLGLDRIGEPHSDSPELLLKKLLASKNSGVQQQAYLNLIDFLAYHSRFDEAEELARQATAKWPDNSGLNGGLLTIHLLSGRPEGVRTAADVAQKALAKAGPTREDDGWLSVAALSAVFAKSPGWQSTVERFLKKQHVYVDYIRMIAAAYDSSSAVFAAALKERWEGADPATWPQRLRNGDASAWREMLIGNFLGRNESAGLFPTVTDQAKWDKSDLSQLPVLRRGLECEAWFYEAMRARAHGERERMLESLRQCEKTGMKPYWEYQFSVFLLAHPE